MPELRPSPPDAALLRRVRAALAELRAMSPRNRVRMTKNGVSESDLTKMIDRLDAEPRDRD
jgi:hypothetical protein